MGKDINLIVAIGKNAEIGRKGDLIWKISEDLKRFKSLTTGHPVIMGRKTWESLPKKPLPKRENIVLTRQKDFKAEGAVIVNSIEEVLKIVEGKEPFVIGGAEIYNAFLPFVTQLHITSIEDSCEDADAFLPIDFSDGWTLTQKSSSVITPEGLSYQYLTYQK